MEVITLGATFCFLFMFFIVGGMLMLAFLTKTIEQCIEQCSPKPYIFEKHTQNHSSDEPIEVIALKAKLLTLHKKVNSMTPEQVKEVDFVISSF